MNERGLTLLEALVAITVTVLVLLVLAGVTEQAVALRAAATREADRTTGARSVLLGMAAELEAALPARPSEDTPPLELTTRPGEPVHLRFSTTAGAGDATSTLAYSLAADRGHPGRYALVRREASRPAPPGAGAPEGNTLLEALREFRVRCFDGSTWSAGWTRARLPRAIELAAELDDGQELTTTVVLALAER